MRTIKLVILDWKDGRVQYIYDDGSEGGGERSQERLTEIYGIHLYNPTMQNFTMSPDRVVFKRIGERYD